MRIGTKCAFCSPEDTTAIPLDIEINDDLFLKFTCPRGHENSRYIETERFSVLFDLGMFALEDGYSRESVASFAAAIERMHEFFIRVSCRKHGLTSLDFNKTWKHVASQSERQYGAFCFLYSLETKAAPEPLPMVEFRNKVVHKGYLPSHAQTLDYARQVHDYMVKVCKYMNAKLLIYVSQIHSDNRQSITNDLHNSNMSVRHYVPYATTHTKYYEISLDEKMQKKKSYRWLVPGAGPIQSVEHLYSVTGATCIIARQSELNADSMPLMVVDASDIEAE